MVRLSQNGVVVQTKTVSLVSIGDVFVIAGQSNAMGPGTNPQTYSHPTLTAARFGNNYQWGALTDPVDINTGQVDTVSSDSGAAGSAWLRMAHHLMNTTNVPIALVPCPLSGTSITQWQPGGNHFDRTTLYGSMAYRVQQTGARCVLWWQGEADAAANMAQATYNAYLDTIADTLAADIPGAQFMPCLLHTMQSVSATATNRIRAAVTEAWGDNPNMVQGADLSALTSDDDNHLKSDENLDAAGALWAAAIEQAFYS